MANDSSLGAAETQAFDLETQKGVMHLLASVRASELDGERKNELRDLVFEYTNGGRDETVHRSLMQKVEAYGVTPIVVATPEPETEAVVPETYEFGTSRPSPSFTPPSAAAKRVAVEDVRPETDSAPADLPVVSDAPPVMPEEEPVPEPKPDHLPPTSEPEPQAKAEGKAPEPAAETPKPVPEPSAPAPAPEPPAPASKPTPAKPQTEPDQANPEPPKPAPEPPAPEPKPEPEPEPKPETEPVSAAPEPPVPPASPDVPERSLQRIREIKSIVNDRVGNPVNLVDIDNEVGREYMAALLDAMKKLNSGTSPASAMQRLEAAFSSVEKTLDEKGDTPPPKPESAPKPAVPAPAPRQAPEADVAYPAPMTESEPPMHSSPQQQPQPVTPPVAPAPAPAPVPEAKPAPVIDTAPKATPSSGSTTDPVKPPQAVPVPPRPKPQAGGTLPNVPPAPQSDVAKRVTVEPPKIVPKGAPGPQSKQLSPKEVATAWGPETDTMKNQAPAAPVTENPAPQSITPKAASLAQSETKLRTPNDLPLASSLETSSVSGDPLFTRQVDDGLEQLLSEWSLFKKSGLFGTGPKGREHPLYKKLADLQIPLLLAGRFEGATQEIKQSITDYMNGWRYEQGIIYEQGETFEHFLRRVIRHILDLQQGTEKS